MIAKKNSGFTLLELLIVVALIGIIVAAALVFLNPLQQINKAKDLQRVRDLDVMKKAFEDFYNDHGCYPKPIEICYPGSDNGNPVSKNPCYICGNQSNSPSFSPYLSKLPCDPDFTKKKYLYQVDNISCPTWFKTYTDFNNTNDPQSVYTGCDNGGCGPAPNYGYDYGDHSYNVKLGTSPFYFCYNKSQRCNNCGNSTACHNNTNCTTIYGTFAICCSSIFPKPKGCP